MKNLLIVITLLSASFSVSAEWAKFAHVTPDNQKEYGISVDFMPVSGRPDNYNIHIQLRNVDTDKHAWLIVTPTPTTEDMQFLRNLIWQVKPTDHDILVKTKLFPVVTGNEESDGDTLTNYWLELDRETLSRSYVYIDFPEGTFDGGYFYSVDLASYGKSINQSANKALKADAK